MSNRLRIENNIRLWKNFFKKNILECDFRKFGRIIFIFWKYNFGLWITRAFLNKTLQSREQSKELENDSWLTYAKWEYILSRRHWLTNCFYSTIFDNYHNISYNSLPHLCMFFFFFIILKLFFMFHSLVRIFQQPRAPNLNLNIYLILNWGFLLTDYFPMINPKAFRVFIIKNKKNIRI